MARRFSPPRPVSGISGGGFTLLEMVIVIAIIAVMTGGVVSLMVYNTSKKRLQRTGAEVEALAKRARAIAILRQTPYALEFHNGKVRLSPWVEAGIEDPEELAEIIAREEEGLPEDGEQLRPASIPVRDEFSIDGDMVMGVRRWGSEELIVFDNERTRVAWRFDPNGLCEPISVRYEIDEGKSWLEQDYHPLTASVRDYTMEAR
jgi:prepilin-type N-terminal cleavage/methylation domain-containing protein